MIFVAAAVGRPFGPKRSRGCDWTAAAWPERPARDPFTRPVVYIGGRDRRHALGEAVATAALFGLFGEVAELPSAWATAARRVARGADPWPDPREVAARQREREREAAEGQRRAAAAVEAAARLQADLEAAIRAALAAFAPAAADFGPLGLPPTFTADDVRRAYRRAALDAHPDRGGTVEGFVALTRARDAALAAVGACR